MTVEKHELYMSRCLELASTGLGYVAPNPMVGAIIVYDDKIIGEAYHKKFGEAHAEVLAVKDAEARYSDINFSECTIYVSLEPCSHTGKTPPCTELLITHKFKKIVVACEDPFEKVRGKGIRMLRAAGIEVLTGVLEKEAVELNRRFFTFHNKKRPYVILKYAKSKDGYIAALHQNENNRWITNSFSRKLVHRWRSEEQAIIVGSNTAKKDNPALNLRDYPGRQPLRMVIDKELILPSSLQLFDRTIPTIIFNSKKELTEENLELVHLDFNKSVIPQICQELFQRSVQSFIVEGGSILLQSFIDEKLWDEARVFTGNKILDEGVIAPNLKGRLISQHNLADDLLEIYKPIYN